MTEATGMANMLLKVLPIADIYKHKAYLVLDISSEVVEYVHDYSNGVLTTEQKENLSIKLINELLLKLDKQPTDEEMSMIHMLVKQGISVVDKSPHFSFQLLLKYFRPPKLLDGLFFARHSK